jgi:hypothetical protein
MRRFGLGMVVATPGALEVLGHFEVSPSALVERHASGDWGEIPSEDARENELALERGFRVLSSYPLSGGFRVWVITERDRSLTTILLPAEY